MVESHGVTAIGITGAIKITSSALKFSTTRPIQKRDSSHVGPKTEGNQTTDAGQKRSPQYLTENGKIDNKRHLLTYCY